MWRDIHCMLLHKRQKSILECTYKYIHKYSFLNIGTCGVLKFVVNELAILVILSFFQFIYLFLPLTIPSFTATMPNDAETNIIASSVFFKF